MELTRTCPWCGKVRYPTRAAARWYARHTAPSLYLRTYRCPVSDGWHLTSKRPHSHSRPLRQPRRDGRTISRNGRPAVRGNRP